MFLDDLVFFWVYGNPAMPSCQADDLLVQVGPVSGTVKIHANDETATCQ